MLQFKKRAIRHCQQSSKHGFSNKNLLIKKFYVQTAQLKKKKIVSKIEKYSIYCKAINSKHIVIEIHVTLLGTLKSNSL